MATKSKPFEQFGPYVLFKRLEGDALGELFRAARIEGNGVGPFLALRRLSGGQRDALATAAQTAAQLAPSLTGPTFARDQRIEVIGGIPVITHEYASGRSLRFIVDRARGTGAPVQPLPVDQAIVIAERVALSLATTSELRLAGERLLHGGLIPQFVWISDDGEIRVAGQALTAGLAASLRDERVAADIGRYFAPELHHSGVASKATEVYALGAILYLAVTGLEPPDPTRTSAFMHAIRAAKTMDGAPMPDDIRVILEKSLNIDPSARYASPGDMRNALSALTAGGRYSATSFNLAFYLSSLLKKEQESESAEREREARTQVAGISEARPVEPVVAMLTDSSPKKKSRVPMAIAATLTVAAIAAGSWFVLDPKQATGPAVPANLATTIPAPSPTLLQRPPSVPEPIIASATAPEATTTATGTVDEGIARQKAFDDAVKKRLQEEMLKLQAEHTRQLQQRQARNAPVLSSAAAEEPPVPLQQEEPRRAAVRTPEESAVIPPPVTATVSDSTPALTPPPPATASAAVVPSPAPGVREGDVVDMNALDAIPTATREPRPVYPTIAARQKIEATIMASVLISETGEVLDVKILRGDPRFGFNDSAIRAFRAARYTPPMKDGKRVRTWIAQMIQFRP